MAALVIDRVDSVERPGSPIIETNIPARLERLLWGRFHTLVVIALGITWILDGLEVTLAGALAPALKQSPQLHFSNAEVGLTSSAYLAGAVLGAIFFGWLTDRLGRKYVGMCSDVIAFWPAYLGQAMLFWRRPTQVALG